MSHSHKVSKLRHLQRDRRRQEKRAKVEARRLAKRARTKDYESTATS